MSRTTYVLIGTASGMVLCILVGLFINDVRVSRASQASSAVVIPRMDAAETDELFEVQYDVLRDAASSTNRASESLEEHGTLPEVVASIRVPVEQFGTVRDAMDTYAAATDFTYDGREYPGLGFFVETINGRRAEQGMYWILYINGDSADLGISRAAVGPDDRVEWRYEASWL